MVSFLCYDNSDVIVTLIITNFHLYLIHVWCQFQFPNICVWRRSLCSNLGGIDSEKLYRATLKVGLQTTRKTFVLVRSLFAFFFFLLHLKWPALFPQMSNERPYIYRRREGTRNVCWFAAVNLIGLWHRQPNNDEFVSSSSGFLKVSNLFFYWCVFGDYGEPWVLPTL